MASQAIVLSQSMTAGTTIALPKGRRAAGIWAMPVRGPIALRTPTRAAPMRLPTTIAQQPVDEAQAQDRGEHADGEGGRHEVRREPHREQPPHRAIAGRLRDRLHAVALDGEVALALGHRVARQCLDSHP